MNDCKHRTMDVCKFGGRCKPLPLRGTGECAYPRLSALQNTCGIGDCDGLAMWSISPGSSGFVFRACDECLVLSISALCDEYAGPIAVRKRPT